MKLDIDYSFLEKGSMLVTGATGSFGKELVGRLVERVPNMERLVVFSRDEFKQYEMSQMFPPEKYPFIRYFLGDVRDEARLRRAMERIDYVVHAAALKQVPAAEYNPMEFIKTNVLGAQNVIEASIDAGVRKVVALSTDKACSPINFYGATKLCSDKLFVSANNIAGGHGISFSVVRYGNVMGSRGSVIPFFLDRQKDGVLPITDPAMTRFNILLPQGVDMVLHSLQNSVGGELLVPKIPSYRITDLAEAVSPSADKPVVGVRPGEKIHESMISTADSYTTVDVGDYYVVLPQGEKKLRHHYVDELGAKPVEQGFTYNSGKNDEWLSVEALRALICEQVDPNFEPA